MEELSVMSQTKTPVTRRSLFSWIWSSNLKLQALLLLVIVITVFARVLPLEMQKRIINEAIRFGKIQLLLVYCGLYLAAVVVAVGLKYLINALQNIIGEQALADMRKGLYHHILTLPLNFFRKTQPGLVVTSLVTELASAGNFVGMAIAVPVFTQHISDGSVFAAHAAKASQQSKQTKGGCDQDPLGQNR
jgi:ABC-type bacteriocin/lantibiotic exporter with double-glycine peptidase domain